MATSASHKDELPGSRRGLCLGCAALVVTARDAHVLFGGRRDGSFLAMFDAAPLLMLATDPDRLFEPALNFLGWLTAPAQTSLGSVWRRPIL